MASGRACLATAEVSGRPDPSCCIDQVVVYGRWRRSETSGLVFLSVRLKAGGFYNCLFIVNQTHYPCFAPLMLHSWSDTQVARSQLTTQSRAQACYSSDRLWASSIWLI